MIKKLLATTIVAASTAAQAGGLSFSIGVDLGVPIYTQPACIPVYSYSQSCYGPTVYGPTVYTSQGAYIPVYTEPVYVAPVPQVRYEVVPVYVAPHYECAPREYIHGEWRSSSHHHSYHR